MPAILVLRHNKVSKFCNQRILSNFLDKNDLSAHIIASDFSIPEDDSSAADFAQQLREYLKELNDVFLIFFEANYGNPGQPFLGHPAKELLKHLCTPCPEATIVLKSNTIAAIDDAQAYLKSLSFPERQVILSPGVDILDDRIKAIIVDKAVKKISAQSCAVM